jgi:hypothetical protein
MEGTGNTKISYPFKKIPYQVNLLGMKPQRISNQACEINKRNSPKNSSTKINVRSLILSPEQRNKMLKGSLSLIKSRNCPQKQEYLKDNQKLNNLYHTKKIYHFYEPEKSSINYYNKNIFNSNLLTNKLIKQKLKIVNTNKEKDHFGDFKPTSTSMSFYPNATSALNESNNIPNTISNNQQISNIKPSTKTSHNFMKKSQSLISLNKGLKRLTRNEDNIFKENISFKRSRSSEEIQNYNDLLKPTFKTTSHAIINLNAFRSKTKIKDIYDINNELIKTFNKSYFRTRYFEGFNFDRLKLDGYELIRKVGIRKE